MESIYLIIVVVLLILAVCGLVVGVANDAVNFLNSAVGSKVAPRAVILAVASTGIIIGALTSSGMMEVARSGVFHPQMFTFHEVMMLFLGVMFANVILLDLFNTAGLPTSTTVSLVFGLLGSAIAAASVKIWGAEGLTIADLSQYINSGKALAIIAAILISVVIAFACGTAVMYFTRVIFTFRYHKVFGRLGALWCGVALTAIVYFALFKGFKDSSLMDSDLLAWINRNMALFIFGTWAACSAALFLMQHLLNVNILRITILAGTFSLALAFAGNDLVNFIGVPIAGYDSYLIMTDGGSPDMTMGELNKPVTANFLFLLAAGIIMVVTLWTSKKAKTVADTEINLAKQDAGMERFGSTLVSRGVVRMALNANKFYERFMPGPLRRQLDKRFLPLRASERGDAPFDMIRATVNLTVASLLISMATSLKLPLSTTYVTFMVAMGSSLADRAWGRESAVYRITGVLAVVSGWFLTALIAFLIAYGVTLGLMYGGTVVVLAMSGLCAVLIVQSSLAHGRKLKKQRSGEEQHTQSDFSDKDSPDDIIEKCTAVVRNSMKEAIRIYQETLRGVYGEDRKALRRMVRESEELFLEARDRKYHMMPTLQILSGNHAQAGHYYVQVVDYVSEMAKALVHITRPCFTHIDNNHEGLSLDQVEDLSRIADGVADIYRRVNDMLKTNDFDDINEILDLRDALFELIAGALNRQLRRIRHGSASTKASMLYITILNETKNMVLQSRNLLKSQKYFIENCEDNPGL